MNAGHPLQDSNPVPLLCQENKHFEYHSCSVMAPVLTNSNFSLSVPSICLTGMQHYSTYLYHCHCIIKFLSSALELFTELQVYGADLATSDCILVSIVDMYLQNHIS